jgi:hypothetical protein
VVVIFSRATCAAVGRLGQFGDISPLPALAVA